jgi:hypothetical protein
VPGETIDQMAGGPRKEAPRDPRPQVMFGQVTRAPADEADTMEVVTPDYSSDHPYVVPGSNWAPRHDGALPVADAGCVVLIDNRGDAWVSVFEVA